MSSSSMVSLMLSRTNSNFYFVISRPVLDLLGLSSLFAWFRMVFLSVLSRNSMDHLMRSAVLGLR